MALECSHCGRTSQDDEFCDHCNAELRAPQSSEKPPARCPIGAEPVPLKPEQVAHLSHPEAALLVRSDERWHRVHWLARAQFPRWLAAVQERIKHNDLPCLPPVRLVEEADGAWVSADLAGEPPQPWSEASNEPYADLRRLQSVLERLAQALEQLHSRGLLWLTFDPLQLEETAEGRLRFTNLDLVLYRQGECPERASYHSNFMAPEISSVLSEQIGPRTDVFHLGMFAYYWLARLLPDGYFGEGLESFSYRLPALRTYAPSLPPGIMEVIAQATASDPGRRYATPRALCKAFGEAVQRAEERRDFSGTLRWDIGWHTRTGRSKTALGRANEDNVLVCPFSDPERALVAVADGITTCDVGSGALASLITMIVLENAFTDRKSHEAFAEAIGPACQRGAQALLDWAIEKGYRDQLRQGADLMGTTLLAGWLEERSITLANLGDSRAYLVHGQGIEQLTVDGDLGTSLLAEGAAPEEVRQLGQVAKSLRECIGGCRVTAAGEIMMLEESSRPRIGRWPLVPGDVLILCSDGLVEEDAFIEPEILAELVRSHRDLPAQDLALFLCDYADGLQRLPSALEPDGFGDNISCIVVKILKT